MKQTLTNNVKQLNVALPDGEYEGIASGYVVSLTVKGIAFELELNYGFFGG